MFSLNMVDYPMSFLSLFTGTFCTEWLEGSIVRLFYC